MTDKQNASPPPGVRHGRASRAALMPPPDGRLGRLLHVWFAALVMSFALFCALHPSVAHSQQLADATKGKALANGVCATCHNVKPGGVVSPDRKATPFQLIADTPGINERALLVFFRTPHQSMPNLVIAGEEADNIIAYILSLKAD